MSNVVDLAAFARSRGVRLQRDQSKAAELLPVNGRSDTRRTVQVNPDPIVGNPVSEDQLHVFNPGPVVSQTEAYWGDPGGIPPEHQWTKLHGMSQFKSRREYFWWASQKYNIDVEEIQKMAFHLGVTEDFDRLVSWMRSRDSKRNR